jgi:hypothetical protein
MFLFYFKHGLAYQKITKIHDTCQFLFHLFYKDIGFFEINFFVFYLKKIAKLLNFLYIKNLKIQILYEDFLIKKYRYFWKDNSFFSKFLQLNLYHKIRLTLLKNFQNNLNYFTKKNKFYSIIKKKFFKKFLIIKEKIFQTKITQTIPDLLILLNPLNNKYTNQALLRQIPTILFTNASHNLNNYTYFGGLNIKNEIKLTLILSLIKKIMQFFFFNKNIKFFFWKFYFLKNKYISKKKIKYFYLYNINKNIYFSSIIKKTKKIQKKNNNFIYKLYFQIFKQAYIKINLRPIKNIRLKARYKLFKNDILFHKEFFKKARQDFKQQQKFLYKQQQRTRNKKKKYLLKHLPKYSMFQHNLNLNN